MHPMTTLALPVQAHPALRAAVQQLPALVNIAATIVGAVNPNAAKTVEVIGGTVYALLPGHLKPTIGARAMEVVK